MRIVIDARESGTSTGRYIDKLIEYLQQIDSKNTYQVLYKKHRFGIGQTTAPNFSEVLCDVKEFTFAEQTTLLRQLNSLHPDLVHFGKDHQPILYHGKKVTTMHDLTTIRFRNPAKNPLIFGVKQMVLKFVVRIVARTSRFVFAPTEFVKQDIKKYTHVDPAKIIVTLEAGDKITVPAEPVTSLQNSQYIMYIGRPQPHKNLGRLLEAFAKISQNYPDLNLVLAGKKDVLFLQHERRAGELGIGDKVVFTDFVSEAQLRWLYENCQAYVFPSLSEGFGLPPLEAMMHGAPVVASNATCIPEVCGDAALYFDPENIDDMAKKIVNVLTDQKLRSDLIARGYKQSAKYSWKRMAEQTLEVYARANIK